MSSNPEDISIENTEIESPTIADIAPLKNWVLVSPPDSPPYNAICKVGSRFGTATGWLYTPPDSHVQLIVTVAHVVYNLKEKKCSQSVNIERPGEKQINITSDYFYINWFYLTGETYKDVQNDDWAMIVVPKIHRYQDKGFESFITLQTSTKDLLAVSSLGIAGYPAKQIPEGEMWTTMFDMPGDIVGPAINTNVANCGGVSGSPVWGLSSKDKGWEIVGMSAASKSEKEKTARILLVSASVKLQIDALVTNKSSGAWIQNTKVGQAYPQDYIRAPYIDIREVICPVGKKVKGIRFVEEPTMVSINLYCTNHDGTKGEWIGASGPENKVSVDNYPNFCSASLTVPEGKDVVGVCFSASIEQPGVPGVIAPAIAYYDDNEELKWKYCQRYEAGGSNTYQDLFKVFPYSSGYKAVGIKFWQKYGNRIAPSMEFQIAEE